MEVFAERCTTDEWQKAQEDTASEKANATPNSGGDVDRTSNLPDTVPHRYFWMAHVLTVRGKAVKGHVSKSGTIEIVGVYQPTL